MAKRVIFSKDYLYRAPNGTWAIAYEAGSDVFIPDVQADAAVEAGAAEYGEQSVLGEEIEAPEEDEGNAEGRKRGSRRST